jgi:hypothetical protein
MLLSTVLLKRVTVPTPPGLAVLKIPPPSLTDELPAMLLFVIVITPPLPLLAIAPPLAAWFWRKALLVIERFAPFKFCNPPPFDPVFPLRMVRPTSATFPVVVTLKTRTLSLPLMLIGTALLIVRDLSMTSSVPSMIVCPDSAARKSIVSPAEASAMACRSEPGPALLTFITWIGAANTVRGSKLKDIPSAANAVRATTLFVSISPRGSFASTKILQSEYSDGSPGGPKVVTLPAIPTCA